VVKAKGGAKIRRVFMSEPALTTDLLTYAEAAEVTRFSRNYIANLVSQGTLHPLKVAGRHSKYLRKEEVEWLQRRRSGVNEPNPLDESAQMAPAIPGVDLSAVDAALQEETAHLGSTAAEDKQVVGFMLIVLMLGLLFAFMQKKQPNQEELERFKRAPEFKPLRQAIHKLAGQLDAA
jgi:excisionase family DNA binding protein